MRGQTAFVRVFSLATAATIAATTGVAGADPTSAYAAPVCTEIQPGTRIRELPWAQRRLAPERLAPLADGSGVTVAVIDSGVERDHPQLRDRVLRGADFLDSGSTGTRDCAGHGTGVASLIAAGPPPAGVSFRGLAPGVKILPVRVSEQQTIGGETQGRTASVGEFAEAIRWAVRAGADVINLSVVLTRDVPAVRAAIADAVAADVVVVAAAGNGFGEGNPVPYPAAYDGVLAVGAIGPDSLRQDYSQVGRYVDVVAPGGDITVAWPDGDYAVQSGTSYAAPFVAATAALVLDYRPDLSAAEVVRRIEATADPAPGGARSPEYGAGVVNPYRALTETVALGAPEPASALPVSTVDPVAAAAARRRAELRDRALLVAGTGGGVAVLVLLAGLVLPRGSRRRWRPAEPG